MTVPAFCAACGRRAKLWLVTSRVVTLISRVTSSFFLYGKYVRLPYHTRRISSSTVKLYGPVLNNGYIRAFMLRCRNDFSMEKYFRLLFSMCYVKDLN